MNVGTRREHKNPRLETARILSVSVINIEVIVACTKLRRWQFHPALATLALSRNANPNGKVSIVLVSRFPLSACWKISMK